jgi:ethanolamine utilization protein EutN
VNRGIIPRKYLISRLTPRFPTLDGTRYILALDMVGAGVGQTVLVEDEGNSARQILEDPKAPVRSLIIAIVDKVDVPAQGGV